MTSVPNCVPHLIGNEVQYLTECVKTGWVSPVGPFVDRFEKLFAAYHGMEQAASASSGTAAIHLGLMELGVKPGDLVLSPAMTFVGTVNPVRYCGADVILLDADPRTLNLDPNCLADFLKSETERRGSALLHRPSGRRISALIVAHLYGNPADMSAIMGLAERYGLPVLEDAAESLGARYGERLVGTIGGVGCFSFNGNKVITTGGGGMLIARDPPRVIHAKHLATTARTDKFDFIHDEVGYNYRLSNLCAAVGVAQMEHLDEFLRLKRAHAEAYRAAFARTGRWKVLAEPANTFGTYWMTLAQPAAPGDGSVVSIVRACAAAGIGVRPVWKPLHRIPAYEGALYFGGTVAEQLYQTTFCLPSSVGLTHQELEATVVALERAA